MSKKRGSLSTVDNNSDSLSIISECSEHDLDNSDNDDLLDSLVYINGKSTSEMMETQVQFDTDNVSLDGVVDHNKHVLSRDNNRNSGSKKLAKVLAQQIVDSVLRTKRDFLQIQLAANGYGPHSHLVKSETDFSKEDIGYD